MKIMATSFKRSHACTAILTAPNPAAGHHQPKTLLETPGHWQASLGQSLVGSLLPFTGSWCTRFCLCPPRVYLPVLCKFWQLYGGVNGDLLQEGLCHTWVCCTQSRCPCGSPLLTCTSTGDAQAQFCLSLCGVPGSWCTQDLFEPAECLWQELGLILKVNLPLIPSFWGFSFALGCGVSPHSCFSTVQSPLQCLPSCWDFSDLGHGVSPHGCSSEVQLLLLILDVGYLLTASPTPHSCTVFHKLCKIFNTSLSNRLCVKWFCPTGSSCKCSEHIQSGLG